MISRYYLRNEVFILSFVSIDIISVFIQQNIEKLRAYKILAYSLSIRYHLSLHSRAFVRPRLRSPG